MDEKEAKNKTNEKVPETLKESRQLLIKDMRIKIDNYFRLVVRNLRDLIPKMVGKFLVRDSQV